MALTELFTTDIGLLSLFTIGFILVMAVFIANFVKRHVKQDSESAASSH